MAVKLIASDLDGTLLTNKKELSPRTREALDLAAAQGIYQSKITGRNLRRSIWNYGRKWDCLSPKRS